MYLRLSKGKPHLQTFVLESHSRELLCKRCSFYASNMIPSRLSLHQLHTRTSADVGLTVVSIMSRRSYLFTTLCVIHQASLCYDNPFFPSSSQSLRFVSCFLVFVNRHEKNELQLLKIALAESLSLVAVALSIKLSSHFWLFYIYIFE